MASVDFELESGLLCRAIGRAVVDFIAKTGETEFGVSVDVDVPDVSYMAGGKAVTGPVVRVYLDLNNNEED